MNLSRYQEHYSSATASTVRLVRHQPDPLPDDGHQRHEGALESVSRPVRGKNTARLLVYPSKQDMGAVEPLHGGICLHRPGYGNHNKAPISIGSHAVISQGTFLCTASHDISDPGHALVTAPITVEDRAWVAAQACGHGGDNRHGSRGGSPRAVFRDVAPGR
ncbi:MAG: putative colanic acid biosynthesis acetyltransferase [Akkermansia sp.]